jgi:hypothetical protein
MGTSFTDFNGKGFWTRDPLLEVWLGALVQEIDHLSSLSEWLTLVRQEWHLQAVVGFGGYVSPDLERWVTTDEEKRLPMALSEQAMFPRNLFSRWEERSSNSYRENSPQRQRIARLLDMSANEASFRVEMESLPDMAISLKEIQ